MHRQMHGNSLSSNIGKPEMQKTFRKGGPSGDFLLGPCPLSRGQLIRLHLWRLRGRHQETVRGAAVSRVGRVRADPSHVSHDGSKPTGPQVETKARRGDSNPRERSCKGWSRSGQPVLKRRSPRSSRCAWCTSTAFLGFIWILSGKLQDRSRGMAGLLWRTGRHLR